MNGDTFHTWLTDIDKEMKKKRKNILLFIDNCTEDEEQEEDVTDVPTNWEKVCEALDLQRMEFKEFASLIQYQQIRKKKKRLKVIDLTQQ